MARNIEIAVDVYLVNSGVYEISELRRKFGVVALWLARRLLKSELRVEKISEPCKPPPMRYWQHDETGRVCKSVLALGDGWGEITEEQYEMYARSQRVMGGRVPSDAVYKMGE